MSLKNIKAELATMQAEEKQIPDTVIRSSNGIRYIDPRPLKYCKKYGLLTKPTMKSCRRCGYGLEVLELVEEQREMFLDPESGNVVENVEEIVNPVYIVNLADKRPSNAPEPIPVTAFMKIATVKLDDKNAMMKIIYDRFQDATDCPGKVYCKP